MDSPGPSLVFSRGPGERCRALPQASKPGLTLPCAAGPASHPATRHGPITTGCMHSHPPTPGHTHMLQVLVSAMVAVWAVRLGTFLVQRVHKVGKDSRFDEVGGWVRTCMCSRVRGHGLWGHV